MIKRLFRTYRDQKGITGLETAIILIAFVVVAAVFAYTVLSAGLFSTQKSQEAVYAGLNETQSTMEVRGSLVAYKGGAPISNSVGKVEITVSAQGGASTDLTPPYQVVGGALSTTGLKNPMQITYSDENTTVSNCAWSLSFIGKEDGDYQLEGNEQALITVWLHDYNGTAWSDGSNPPFLGSNYIDTNHNFTLEIKPANGAVLTLERTTPAYLDPVMDLH